MPALVGPLIGLIALFIIPRRSYPPGVFGEQIAAAIVLISLILPIGMLYPYRMDTRSYLSTQIVYNAEAVAESAIAYARDHNHQFPPHPALLVLDKKINLKLRISSDAEYQPPDPTPPESAWATIAADLTLPAPGTLDPAIILAYSKSHPHVPNHRILAFADSTAQLIPDADLPNYFAASNAARAKLSLPPFTLDGPAPTPAK